MVRCLLSKLEALCSVPNTTKEPEGRGGGKVRIVVEARS